MQNLFILKWLFLIYCSSLVWSQQSTKLVPLVVEITYDVEPIGTVQAVTILTSKQTGVRYKVKTGDKVKPGKYTLDIICPGYSFGIPKQIEILPRKNPYIISEGILEKPNYYRHHQLEFFSLDGKVRATTYEIIDATTNKPWLLEKAYRRDRANLIIKFLRFQTVHLKTVIPKDPKNFLLIPQNLDLKPLKNYKFYSQRKYITINNIDYPFIFYSDSKPIESHLISVEKGADGYHWMVRAKPEAKVLQLSAGYYYMRQHFVEAEKERIDRFSFINSDNLLTHLKRLAINNNSKSFKTVSVLVAKQKFISKIPPSDINEFLQGLLEHVENMQLIGQEAIKKVSLIRKIKKLQNK